MSLREKNISFAALLTRTNAAHAMLVAVIVVSLTIPLIAQSVVTSVTDPWISATTKVLFDDDFSEVRNWNEGLSRPCRTGYGNEGFEVALATPTVDTCVFHLFGAGYFSTNVRIDAYAKLVNGSLNAAYGIEFGHKQRNVEDAYFFVINAEGKYGLVWAGDNTRKAIIPWTADESIKHGVAQENRLAIEISGSSVRLYVNGKYLRSATLGSDITGYIGLEVDPKIKVAFRHVRISEFSQRGAVDDFKSALSVGKDVGPDADIPIGRNGACVPNRSKGYLTLTRLPSANGPCAVTVSSTMEAVHFAPTPSGKHLRIVTTARLLQGSDTGGYGLEFSLASAGHTTDYYFEISGNGYAAVFSIQNEHRQKLIDWQRDDLIKSGYNVDNQLVVEIFGSRFYCFVDGKYVASVGIPNPDILEFGYAVDIEPLSAGFEIIEFRRIAD